MFNILEQNYYFLKNETVVYVIFFSRTKILNTALIKCLCTCKRITKLVFNVSCSVRRKMMLKNKNHGY